MSEYQYYEFQTIDRSLTQVEQRALGQLSSRVQLSSTKAVFTYSYGDFPGNPKQVLAKYFDAMFYLANWGTLQLMFRFPKAIVDLESIKKYCVDCYIEVSEINQFVILDLQFDSEEGFGWIEGEGYLSSLIDLRQEILHKDYRLLYLAWLKAITSLDLEPKQFEPPVPSNLGKLSSALQTFVDIFEIERHLLKVAATDSKNATSISEEQLKSALEQLSPAESNTFLLRLAKGEPNLSLELHNRLLEIMGISQSKSQGQRTVEQLLESTEQERLQAERKKQQLDKAKRIQELEALASQENSVWETVDNLIQKGQSKSYDEAIQLLLKLRDLADHQDQNSNFKNRINQLSNKYNSRSGLKKRLIQVKLI